MFGGSRIKVGRELRERLTKAAEIAGYSSVDEFVTHVLEKELGRIEGGESEEEIKKRLEGLGYIS
ncbi:MAG: hypothetical protein IH969_05710 [Candidatus Krumholzibacteriota bacterium]|nr:hypothetical protein [Candidatus Krumholzibacteriota bacterium]